MGCAVGSIIADPRSHSVDFCWRSSFQTPPAMQIFIKTLTGRRTNFNFEPDNTVRHIKEAQQEKEGIQVEQIRLIYSGKQMSDECTLADYNVKSGSTVHMVLQLRGGCGC